MPLLGRSSGFRNGGEERKDNGMVCVGDKGVEEHAEMGRKEKDKE